MSLQQSQEILGCLSAHSEVHYVKCLSLVEGLLLCVQRVAELLSD